MHVLREIAAQAVSATSGDGEVGLTLPEIYRLLDVSQRIGHRNLHLANPLNRDRNVFYFRPREKPFTGDEAVDGQFLVLTYCAHDPFITLEDHDSLASLETSILSDGGIINPLISCKFAFKDFRLVPYQISYCRRGDGAVVIFNKQDQYEGNVSIREEYNQRRIEWTGE